MQLIANADINRNNVCIIKFNFHIKMTRKYNNNQIMQQIILRKFYDYTNFFLISIDNWQKIINFAKF